MSAGTSNYLFYGTPQDRLRTEYPHFQQVFSDGRQFTTRLPANVVLIRVVAVVALAAYVIAAIRKDLIPFFGHRFVTLVLSWPIALVGFAFVAWTIYSHILYKDPMFTTLKTVVGGEEKFQQLPKIVFEDKTEPLAERVKKIQWENLEHPVYRGETDDGRQFLLVRALGRVPAPTNVQTNAVFVFVQRLGPVDFDPRKGFFFSKDSSLSLRAMSLIESVFHALVVHQGNTFGKTVCSGSGRESRVGGGSVSYSYKHTMCSSISSEMANEFRAQLREHPVAHV